MSSQLVDPQALFLHQLGEMLYVERTLADQILPQLGNEVHDEQLRGGIEQHRQQTQDHASNIERAFEALGQQPQTYPSPALEGLKQSHDQTAGTIGSDQLLDLFDAEAAAKTEHLEIASYKGLIMMAKQMGQNDVADLLQANCRQEEQTLQQLEQMSQQIGSRLQV
jgi:ferritin-like metal-binding protein YciE